MDPNDQAYLSEVDSLSDSDWLDISSRASDNDSLAGSDVSDREDVDLRSPSRQSLASISGSHRSEVHVWEGILEDAVDETPAAAGDEHQDLPLSEQSLSFRVAALSEAAVARHSALGDPEEDQRVKDALDQSMVSTLSASRSNSLNSSITHSRDLRLSFPDPLTSSTPSVHDLNPSYEDISVPSDADFTPSEGETHTLPVVHEEPAPMAADSVTSLVPVVAHDSAGFQTEIHSSSIIDFYIVLYGFSSAMKHRVAHAVLEKLMAATQCGFSSLPSMNVPCDIRTTLSGGRRGHSIVSIVDRTQKATGDKEPSSFTPLEPLGSLDRPSLAIVLLPSPDVVLSQHTLYLPVLSQLEEDLSEKAETTDRLLDAEQQWENMGVPASQLVSRAFTSTKSLVVEEDEIERASRMRVARYFKPLLPWSEHPTGYSLASRHTLTLIAILSIVLGYLVNRSLPGAMTRRPSPTIELARPLPAPVVNASISSTPITTPTGMALISSSLKDFALAAISPYAVASTSSSSVATKAIPSPTSAAPAREDKEADVPSECSCGCGLITWPDKFKPTTDLSLRPTAQTPSVHGQTFHPGEAPSLTPTSSAHGNDKGKARATDEDNSIYSLSVRLAGALTEYLDWSTVFAPDTAEYDELFEALDELASSVESQAESMWTQSRDALTVMREHIRTRNERARCRAKELRAAGERLIETVRGNVATARENAKGMRERVLERRRERRRRVTRWEHATRANAQVQAAE
ncbi:uncharacterized protein BXZ73DRAFT_86712 [Epithele typhae]|uniref:uncharacterized protein n=1 Tax=Epithele typhae TaxID=378194 RepID=UPI00200769D2|nr:uncharacterized protein BXZ73DRAFT_86712 [Epithele typhae]KAH9945169.1 hypothetical protein BXZ73DRAFT_86712 [Epithele typhae]